MEPTRIGVTAAAGAYSVIIGAGVIDALPTELEAVGLGPRRIVVSSKRVWPLHGNAFRGAGPQRPAFVGAGPLAPAPPPPREYRAGLYEVIKYGVISDPSLLDHLRTNL